MKKILIFISILFLSGCTNYNGVELIENSTNTLFCYKEYKDYEEYIEFNYKDNVVEYINYSYSFGKDIKKYSELDKYSDYIKYGDNTLDVMFENIDVNLYKEIKDSVTDLYKIKSDSYNYIENNVIKYSLFRNYLEDYSCE